MRRHRIFVPLCAILCFWGMGSSAAFCAEVVYIDVPSSALSPQQQLESAAQFYGLGVHVVTLASPADRSTVISAIKDTKNVAVVLAADALPVLDEDQVLAAVRTSSRRTPIMITGITERSDSASLRKWSANAIEGCAISSLDRDASLQVAEEAQITRQLGGINLPLSGNEVRSITLNGSRHVTWLIAANRGVSRYPVFAQTSVGGLDIFFSASPISPVLVEPTDLFREPAEFARMAPELLFLRYAAGDKIWHSPGHYANLTIDDAWLREPYGYLQYENLLREMQQHNFHTTIAFIPWNYDRSQAPVAALFREHSDRLSICVHGDNHDHQEFGPFNERPLSGQIADMKQALARMAAFSKLTGIPYDPVMVFPHKISPSATFAYLKRYNYWATVNGENVPSDAEAPSDPSFELRPVTLVFQNFPSVRRYSAEHAIPDSQLAIDAFLDNPIYFYGHQAFFADGIASFDELADKVNRLQPDTMWSSLGEAVRHQYLEKLRDDGDYDALLFSSEVRLENKFGRDVTFFIEKSENGAVPFTVSVEGQPQHYEYSDGRLRFEVHVPAGASREVSIVYQNDLDLSSIDVSKTSVRINAIRYLSDFRDNVVSRAALGRWFIQSYVVNGKSWNIGCATAFGSLIIFGWYVRASRKKQSSKGRLVAKAQ